MSNDPLRLAVIMAAIEPYATVANFSIEDVMSAAAAAVPDVKPDEVADALDALDALAAEGEAELARVNGELKRRGLVE